MEEDKQGLCSTIDDLRMVSEVKQVELLHKEEELLEIKVTKQLLQASTTNEILSWSDRFVTGSKCEVIVDIC